jgi:hypothetical protein
MAPLSRLSIHSEGSVKAVQSLLTCFYSSGGPFRPPKIELSHYTFGEFRWPQQPMLLINHLLFSNERVMFVKASTSGARDVTNILKNYCDASG